VSFLQYWLTTQGLLSGTSISLFVLWLIALVMMVILFVYDAKWFLLPDVIMFPLIGLSVVIASVQIATSADVLSQVYTTLGAVAILGGIYLGLWLISKGAWVGFGDVKLGLALGLLLGSWDLAFLTLFLANLFGLLLVLPGLLTKKISRGAHIPFGPMLMLGFIVSLYFGAAIIEGYLDAAYMLASYSLMV